MSITPIAHMTPAEALRADAVYLLERAAHHDAAAALAEADAIRLRGDSSAARTAAAAFEAAADRLDEPPR